MSKTNKERFPHQIVDVEKELNDELLKLYTGEHTGFVQVGEHKYFYPVKYRRMAETIYNMEVRPDDTWIITYPRSGTNYTQELVYMLANDLDYEKSAEKNLFFRSPFMELTLMIDDHMKAKLYETVKGTEDEEHFNKVMGEQWEQMDKLPSPRFIKTHLPLSLLPPNLLTSGAKVVYSARNPKSAALSFHQLSMDFIPLGFVGDFPTFWDLFERGLGIYNPYFQNVKEAWNLRDHPNLLFVFYEDMMKDQPAGIRKVAEFLGKSYDSKQIEGLIDHLQIDNFRKNPSTNVAVVYNNMNVFQSNTEFVRTGKIEGWKDGFSPKLLARADQWLGENLQDTDLKFPFN